MATSVKLDDDLKGRVQKLAGERRRSAHWIMREAIQQYVVREEARESFKREALASWAEYHATGRHLTGGEVRQWLRAWGSEAEAELPHRHD
jgi:predicted transcriptional regulator